MTDVERFYTPGCTDKVVLARHYDALAAELETERLRLAGCGVAALGYFKGCAPEYDSASLQDVLKLHVECTEGRIRIAALEAALYDVIHTSLEPSVVKRAEIALGIAKENEVAK